MKLIAFKVYMLRVGTEGIYQSFNCARAQTSLLVQLTVQDFIDALSNLPTGS